MPYSKVSDLPASFHNLPMGAKEIALKTMQAVMAEKDDTPENVQQAIFAAWKNIKRKYRKEGYTWVERSAAVLVDEFTLYDCHRLLTDEMKARGLTHSTPWPQAKYASQPTASQVHVNRALGEGMGVGGPRQGVGGADTCVCPKCGASAKHDRGTPCAEATCPKCGAAMTKTAKTAFIRVVKEDDDEQTIAGIVYMADDQAVADWIAKGSPEGETPEVVDTQGDYISEAALTDSYRAFMADLPEVLKSGDELFGVRHSSLSPGTLLLQSALLTKGTRWPKADSEPLDAALSWVNQIRVEDKAHWQAVKEGKLTGFSLEGLAVS